MRSVALLVALLLTAPAVASSLFDDDAILDVTLTGPLTTLLAEKRTREELPFQIEVGDELLDVDVRIRGNSRAAICRFTPLRLDFDAAAPPDSLFADENHLKLVTHCQNGSEKSQDSVLNEFAAYRIFNLVSNSSYRVRLLKIRYEDTDDKQRRLEAPHFGFLIESDDGLASRLGGSVAKQDGILFSHLDAQQTARLSVFQYLIGNKDWSFVASDNDDKCCHNIDLLDVDDRLVPIPYDFDLAALTRASYRTEDQLNQSRRREYVGYCRTPADRLAQALADVQALEDEILAVVRDIPALDPDARERRVKFTRAYFEVAADAGDLLATFERHCIGKR